MWYFQHGELIELTHHVKSCFYDNSSDELFFWIETPSAAAA